MLQYDLRTTTLLTQFLKGHLKINILNLHSNIIIVILPIQYYFYTAVRSEKIFSFRRRHTLPITIILQYKLGYLRHIIIVSSNQYNHDFQHLLPTSSGQWTPYVTRTTHVQRAQPANAVHGFTIII